MRPTIDEQLAGAARLLRDAENDAPAAVAETVRNARRLVERVADGWESVPAFLRADTARTVALLGETEEPPASPDEPLAALAARNERVRGALVERLRSLGPGEERTAIGHHLRRRVDADPT